MENVTKYIEEAGSLKSSDHQFEPTDGIECRENYIALENMYLDDKASYDAA